MKEDCSVQSVGCYRALPLICLCGDRRHTQWCRHVFSSSQHLHACRETQTNVQTPALEILFLFPLRVIMRWLLAGCCGLALITVAVASPFTRGITQKPRFYGVPIGRDIGIYCQYNNISNEPVIVEWYKADGHYVTDNARRNVDTGKHTVHNTSTSREAFLYLKKVDIKDSGVYFCRMNRTWGPGTAVQVVRPVNVKEALHRTRMKDGLIVLQGLVLAVCVAALLLRKQRLWERRDSIYEEPETDHIYEGLAIETCGGGLYEELSVYAEAEVAEAPWE